MIGIDPDKVIPDQSLSVYQEAVACWRGEKGKMWLSHLVERAVDFGFPIHKPYTDLSDDQKEVLWTGNAFFEGIDAFFNELEEGAYKIQNRVMLSRYRGKTVCNVCKGGRLRKEATYIQIAGKNITQLINIPIDELSGFFDNLDLNPHDRTIADRILKEISNRLRTMTDIGLGYLTIDRLASTLSGGETQRINLTRTLGSNLTNSPWSRRPRSRRWSGRQFACPALMRWPFERARSCETTKRSSSTSVRPSCASISTTCPCGVASMSR